MLSLNEELCLILYTLYTTPHPHLTALALVSHQIEILSGGPYICNPITVLETLFFISLFFLFLYALVWIISIYL